MHTLSELQSGQLANAQHIKIAAGLSSFPRELFDLVDSLEVLDLSGNKLNALPDDFSKFHQLRILFLSDNNFEIVPSVLSACPALTMVGFKANQIKHIPENALPRNLRWLILTDNTLQTLPSSIGQHQHLQKLMLAGNQLKSLPNQMRQCENLELLRISANQLETLPEWLLQMPKLSWLAFAGNPCSKNNQPHHLPTIHWHELQLGHELGQGASGIISKALWKNDTQKHVEVALKAFKGAVTSDGLPADEMSASIAAGQHQHLIEVLGKLTGHPEGKDGLLLSLLPKQFRPLANPPCLDSCTRDNYNSTCSFTLSHIFQISSAIASAAAHLHKKGISHGDLYGHNILINPEAHVLLSDFGAATPYQHMPAHICLALERLEVRAFGCLLEELLTRIVPSDAIQHAKTIKALQDLQDTCNTSTTKQRPLFAEINTTLSDLILQ